MLFGWEGSSRSGIALATCHILVCPPTDRMASEREVSTAYVPVGGVCHHCCRMGVVYIAVDIVHVL